MRCTWAVYSEQGFYRGWADEQMSRALPAEAASSFLDYVLGSDERCFMAQRL